MTAKRWECDTCNTVSLEQDLLRAPSPFDSDEELVGCPVCKSCDGFTELCELADCEKPATCGGPGEDGIYRRTCVAHAAWLHKGAA